LRESKTILGIIIATMDRIIGQTIAALASITETKMYYYILNCNILIGQD
jgi:hypothetical protein